MRALCCARDVRCARASTGFVYPPLNKPFAIVDWLENGGGRALPDDHEVIICDADFLFLKPLRLGRARRGRPAASSRYYLGHSWLFDDSVVRPFCNGHCANVTRSEVDQYYDAGWVASVRSSVCLSLFLFSL